MSRIVCISNRVALPDPETGEIKAGGLAVGIQAALKANGGGLWFGWDGSVTEPGCRQKKISRTTHKDISFLTLPLTDKEYTDYYKSMANENLWPLMHELAGQIEGKPESFETYKQVNRMFAQLLKPQLQTDDIIWVHDYHLIPLGRELRALDIQNPIGYFHHTPMPGREFVGSQKITALLKRQYEELLKDFFYYDLVGFQSFRDLRNFSYCLPDVISLPGRYNSVPLEYNGRRTNFGVFPISIETGKLVKLARKSGSLNKTPHQEKKYKILIGAERLDYTKGLLPRLQAYEIFLARHPEYHNRIQYRQITPLSRSDIKEYKTTIKETRQAVRRIKDRYATNDWRPLIYTEHSVPREKLIRAFRHSDIGLVTPFIDGQNLVAKEFIAAQNPYDPGLLILSKYAGAAEELKDLGVLCVDPYDPEDIAEKIKKALDTPQHQRVRSYHKAITHLYEYDIDHWAGSFLDQMLEARLQNIFKPPAAERPLYHLFE